jgi:hypothetical protein
MSVELVREELGKFLARSDAEVLCIRGRWGVGKTYAWTTALEQAQKAGLIGLPRYSYVSLFGVNSLDELKFAIFENVITLSGGVVKPDLNTLDAFVSSKIGSWRKLTRLAQSVPIVRNVIGGDATALVSFMTIREQIVCIDDLERRGSKLDVRDVLGLISYLREQRACKVVLILNDEKLDPDASETFGNNLEKVVDLSLAYEPTAAESVAIAIMGTDDTSKLIAERCQSLGITNIRVIRRIERAVRELKPLLLEFDPEVFKAAVASLVLFGWANDQPEEAPSMEFLRAKRRDVFGLVKREDMPEKEVAWSALLDSYGYLWTDELDIELIRATRAGYFDPSAIKRTAKLANQKILAAQADGSFEAAWRKYHDSFASNEGEVLDEIYASFMRNAQFISPTNLNGTVTLFKDLGRPQQAHEMLAHYMATRKEARSFYDLEDDPFGSHVDDSDVRNAFKRRFDSLEEKRDIRSMLLKLKDGWDDETISTLAALPVGEYRKVLKSAEGEELRKILSGVLQFDRIVNASALMREISSRARKALKEIGNESAINKRRVGRLGVKFDDPPAGG